MESKEKLSTSSALLEIEGKEDSSNILLLKQPKIKNRPASKGPGATFTMPKSSVLQRAMNFLPEIATANSKLPDGGAASIEETEDSNGRFIEMNLSLVPRDDSSSDSDTASSDNEENDSNCDNLIGPLTENNIKLRKELSPSSKPGIEDITENVGK